VTQTDRVRREAPAGWVDLDRGNGQVRLPPRSITTLFPGGSGPRPSPHVSPAR
jgi:hypothetical protein